MKKDILEMKFMIFEKINFFNKKIIYTDIYKIYLDKQYTFPFDKKK